MVAYLRVFRSPSFEALLISFTIVSFSFALPLLNDLKSAPFHAVGPLPLLYIILAYLMVPTLVIFVLDRVSASLWPHGGITRLYRTLLVTVLLAIFLNRIMREYGYSLIHFEELPDLAQSAVNGIILGLLLVVCIKAHRPLVLFVTFLFPFSLGLSAVYAYQVVERNNLLGGELAEAHSPVQDHSLPAVFVLVLDQLGWDILQKDGQIDAGRFPNLASLAEDGLLLTNATTSFVHTSHAIPTMLTGKLAPPDLPLPPDQPSKLASDFRQNNLLSLLGQRFNVSLYGDYFTDCISDAFICHGGKYFSEKYPHLFVAEMGRRAVHSLAPTSVRNRLPDLARKVLFPRRVHWSSVQQFNTFVDSIKSTEARGRVYYVHSFIPHQPWVLDEQGSQYDWPIGEATFRGDLDIAREKYSRQVKLADSFVGRFVTRLKSEGIYEHSIIMLTSDHGATAPGDVKLTVDGTARVPLLIRGPDITPGVSNLDYQHEDFAPTLLDVVGLERRRTQRVFPFSLRRVPSVKRSSLRMLDQKMSGNSRSIPKATSGARTDCSIGASHQPLTVYATILRLYGSRIGGFWQTSPDRQTSTSAGLS